MTIATTYLVTVIRQERCSRAYEPFCGAVLEGPGDFQNAFTNAE
jgi:hypothetical protein